MKARIKSTVFKAVLVSLAVLGMRIPQGQAQALFFGAMPEQDTNYNSNYDAIAPATGAPVPVTTTTTTTETTTVAAQDRSLASAIHTAPDDSIDSRLNAANLPARVPNGARSDN